jgi:hypothetical protein
MEAQKDFKELLELLNEQKVKYIIVGGYALAFHGSPRFTGDLDIYVKPDKENAKRILMSLKKFGFGSLHLTQEDFIKPESVIQLGVTPVRVDIITSLSAVTWQQVFAGKKKGRYGDISVFYIGRKELIKNKKATGRTKDMADIESLGKQAEKP